MELNIPSCWLSSPRIHSSPSSSFTQTSSLKLKLQRNGIFQQTANQTRRVWPDKVDLDAQLRWIDSKGSSGLESTRPNRGRNRLPNRLPRKPNRNELLCVSLHGDYRYDQLKNTNKTSFP